MGKHSKKHKDHQNSSRSNRRHHNHAAASDGGDLPSSAYDRPSPHSDAEDSNDTNDVEVDEEIEEQGRDSWAADGPSKFHLYQLSVQSPKGDISYLQKFFLMYVGGRFPLHLQEDFCGTALLSCEWLRSDSRRTVVGVDLDLDALKWCLANNLSKVGADGFSRISLFHGNVLHPKDARLVNHQFEDGIQNLSISEKDTKQYDVNTLGTQVCSNDLITEVASSGKDIICAFNYSCCCLHKRADLVMYFRHALSALSRKGGIFVMDLYGGTSSQCKLRLQRKFSTFTYIWEQAEYDVINCRTRISLHFHLGKHQILKHAFSYTWRLWSIPEIKDCLVEAGFQTIHFWIREMPDTRDRHNAHEYGADRDVKYEELSSFQQQDAWNAYIVGVANVS